MHSEPERTAVRCFSAVFEAFPIFSLASSRHGSKEKQNAEAKLLEAPGLPRVKMSGPIPIFYVFKTSIFLSGNSILSSGAEQRHEQRDFKTPDLNLVPCRQKYPPCFVFPNFTALCPVASSQRLIGQLHLGVRLSPELVPPTSGTG